MAENNISPEAINFKIRELKNNLKAAKDGLNKTGIGSTLYEKYKALIPQYKKELESLEVALTKAKAKEKEVYAKAKAESDKAKAESAARRISFELKSKQDERRRAIDRGDDTSSIDAQIKKLKTAPVVTNRNGNLTAKNKQSVMVSPASRPTPAPDPWLTNYTIGVSNGKQTVMANPQIGADGNAVTGTGGPAYIVWDAKNKQYVPVVGIDAARKLVLEGVGPNGIQKLKDSLVKSRFISKTESMQDDYIDGLNEAIHTYSVSVLQDYQLRAPNDPKAKFGQTFSTYLGTMSSGSDSGSKPVTDRTDTSTSISTRVETNRQLEKYLGALLGQAPTLEDYEAFYNEVTAAENKAKTKVTTETDRSADGTAIDTTYKTVGGKLSEDEYLVMAAKIGAKSLNKIGGDPELLKKLIAGGAGVAQDISALKQHASNQGIALEDKVALDYVMSGLGKPSASGDKLATLKARIDQTAITFYSNNKALADHIANGGTYKDISDIYGAIKYKKLGIVTPNSAMDNDISKAISAGMSGADYERDLQSRPEWMKTEEAHQIAGNYLDTILSKFGFAG